MAFLLKRSECYLEVTNEMALKYVILAQKVCSLSFKVQVFSTPSFLPRVWTFIRVSMMDTSLAKLYNHSDSTSVRVTVCNANVTPCWALGCV